MELVRRYVRLYQNQLKLKNINLFHFRRKKLTAKIGDLSWSALLTESQTLNLKFHTG